ncbi:BLUF domain-containing protein [Brevundimonas sp.]|uniref:BLUF domain-containing protein n=1 Tax=Brevundimonas sp. TaxID=1871086 RepID=UPI0035B1C618
MTLFRIAYCSTARVGMASLLVITDILAMSQRNNARDGLTGALVDSRGHFFQVVEGPAGAIERLLRRLADDRRHADIEIVHREPVTERLFADWSVTVPRLRPELADDLDQAVAACRKAPARAIGLLKRLVDDMAVSDGA